MKRKRLKAIASLIAVLILILAAAGQARAQGSPIAHLMFYTALMGGAAGGADLPNSPVRLTPQFKEAAPIDVFIVPVGWRSDEAPAPVM